eukprot:Sspe_Gene.24383::Locus_9655_Transcript_1_1_Confidence_1.000_Length_1030::g.24383::m.24383
MLCSRVLYRYAVRPVRSAIVPTEHFTDDEVARLLGRVSQELTHPHAYDSQRVVSDFTALWHSLQEGGHQFGHLSFTAAISFFARARRYREAVQYFKRMIAEGHLPDTATFNALLTMAMNSSQPRWGVVARCLRWMETAGQSPDNVTLLVLARCCSRWGRSDGAVAVVAYAQEAGVDVTPSLLSAVIVGVDSVAAALVLASSYQKEVNTVVWNSVLSVCVRLGDAQAAFRTFRTMTAAGWKPSTRTFNLLLPLFRGAGDLLNTLKLVRVMEVNGVPPSVVTYILVIEVCLSALRLNTVHKEHCVAAADAMWEGAGGAVTSDLAAVYLE